MDLEASTPIAVSIIDAARLAAVSRSTIYNAIGHGQLEVKKIGRKTLILRTELERFLHDLPSGNRRAAWATRS